MSGTAWLGKPVSILTADLPGQPTRLILRRVSGQRILVVEDDLGLRDVLARGLRGEDFEVVTATDGQAALRVDLAGVDAIVLDIGLPDSDGRDVCQAIRSRGF